MLGGVSNPLGPLVGAAIVTLLPEFLRVAQDWRMTVFGTLLVVIRFGVRMDFCLRRASPQIMTGILHVEAVSRSFGGYLALNNVSCAVAEGHIHALIGPNGAGKTTLFNVVSGVLRPTPAPSRLREMTTPATVRTVFCRVASPAIFSRYGWCATCPLSRMS